MPRLPPVAISPQMRLRARFWPGLTHSTATFFQSHSSSSATNWASPVSVPCPISERAMRITQVSSGRTTTQALISLPALAAVAASAVPMKGRLNPSASPPPAAAEPTMNLRRERLVALTRDIFFMVVSSGLLRHVRRHVHAGADALIGAAAADVGHRRVDVGVGGVRILLEQRTGRHDLPRLAVAALRHVELRPGLLHRVRARARQPFDRDGGLDAPDRHGAGALHLAVDMHRAGAALRDPAAVLRAGQADLLADDPQERRLGLHLHVADLAVDIEFCHDRPPLTRWRILTEKSCRWAEPERLPRRGESITHPEGAEASGPRRDCYFPRCLSKNRAISSNASLVYGAPT